MTTMKKLVSLLLAAMMLLAVMNVAVAEGETTYTISAPAESKHTYEVYQIFTGDLSGNVLSNVKWGQNAKNQTSGTPVDQKVLDALTAVNSAETDAAKLEVISEYVDLQSTSYGTVTADNSLSAAPGYYLIKDRDSSVTGNDAYTTYIVKVVGNVTINPKSDVPESTKKVEDKNDSDSSQNTPGWNDSADYDIGDEVPFQLTATLPSNLDAYESYTLVFHDEMSDGLTFDPTSVKVMIGENELQEAYYKVVTKDEAGDNPLCTDCDFHIIFENVKAIEGAAANATITIIYTATLNENAVVGSEGNPNISHITYSNNPYNEENMGQTPDDKVTVFTYQLTVDKVDGERNPLNGASFTLYKWDGEDWIAVGAELEAEATMTDGVVTAYTYNWKGLDDGKYKLVETVTPAGYNTAPDVEFTVTADHQLNADDPKLEKVETDANSGVENEIAENGEMLHGKLKTTVINNSGATLPSTGGIGTTIFYAVGGVLVLLAVVLLVTKRRVGEEN